MLFFKNDCLSFHSSFLVQLRSFKDLDVDDHVKEFAAKLFLIPSPPPGPLHLVITDAEFHHYFNMTCYKTLGCCSCINWRKFFSIKSEISPAGV